MKTAHLAQLSAMLAVSALAASLICPPYLKAAAGGTQICTKDTACEVGEFLYDDNYAPITSSATCTIDSKDPSGNNYLSAQSLTSHSDGWYSYSFTAPSTTGLYRSTICCDTGGQHLCLDKSFEVQEEASGGSGSSPSASDIASAVWSYSGRTLSSFGNLISDVWSYATREITGGNINVTQTTSADLTKLQNSVDESRKLLEKLVNKPIIQTTVEDVPDLSEKLEQSKTAINSVYADGQYIQSGSLALASKWNKLSDSDITNTIEDFKARLGDAKSEALSDSLFGQLNWLSTSWNWKILDKVNTTLTTSQQALATLEDSFNRNGKASATYNAVKSLSKSFASLDDLVGSSLDDKTDATLFGNLANVVDYSNSLAQANTNLEGVLGTWTGLSMEQKIQSIKDNNSKIASLNKIVGIKSLFSLPTNLSTSTDQNLTNKILGMRGVVSANQQMLALNPDKTLTATWFELGSIVFKTVITNPSGLVSQDVPLKYYLPEEVKKENILKIDDGLTVDYDTDTGKYFVSGDFKLAPLASKTLSVEVQDIWQMTDEDMQGLRNQAVALAEPLKNTAYFAQGVTLTSDINSSIDKIIGNQKAAVTPEAKIRAYRENQIELNAVNEKLNKLKDLVSSVSSTGSLFGFVGGAQAIAVWGVVIIMVAGFVSLALYMRVIRGKENRSESALLEVDGIEKTKASKSEKKKIKSENHLNTRGKTVKLIAHLASYLALAVVSSGMTALILKSTASTNQTVAQDQQEQQVLGESVTISDEVDQKPQDLGKGGPKIVRLLVPRGQSLSVHSQANSDSDELVSLESATTATEVSRQDNWVNIEVQTDPDSTPVNGWVQSVYVEEGNADTPKTVTIGSTPTGFLRVRTAPGGAEMDKLDEGTKMPYVSENSSWYQIELTDGTTGWISKTYSTLN